MFWILPFFAMISPLPSFSSVDNEPYQKGLTSLQAPDFEAGLKWFALSEKDFPAAIKESLALQALLLTSKELTYNKLIKLWQDGSKLEKVENTDSKMILEASFYEAENKKTLESLKGIAAKLCKKSPPLALTLSLAKLSAELDGYKQKILKGEWLGPQDRKKMESAEWLLNLAGLFSETLGPVSDQGEMLTFKGNLKWDALFHAIGTRLWIAHDYYKNNTWTAASTLCLNAAVEASAEAPYGDIHQKSKELLEKIKAEKH